MSDPRAAYPATSDPRFARDAELRAVGRAAGDLRRGDPVLVRPPKGPALLTLALEQVTDARADTLRTLAGEEPRIVLARQRAESLDLPLPPKGGDAVLYSVDPIPGAAQLQDLADPTRRPSPELLASLAMEEADPAATGSVARLLKIARLLPAALVGRIDRPLGTERLLARTDLLSAGSNEIAAYEKLAAKSLARVSEARVPLYGAENTRIIAYRPADGGLEHLAILVGDPEQEAAPLIRLHSECFTGDLLDSLRCDCGPQLRGAITELGKRGSGIVLYLAQEGRGIGLVNKLRAYTLQDGEFDTVDANEMLGYDSDERVYLPAVEMLRDLGFDKVQLLTNNPDKVAQLAANGIEVSERVSHAFPANGHNEFYLRTKKVRSGHFL